MQNSIDSILRNILYSEKILAIIVIIGILIYFFIKIYDKYKENKRKKQIEIDKEIQFHILSSQNTQTEIPKSKITEEEKRKTEYRNSYQPKYLLTTYEKGEFKKLVNWANKNNLYVFTKVRLLDLIEPRSGQNNFKALLWKIQAKHVDFIICNAYLEVIYIIELQDSSHYRPDRIERDLFIKEVLESCGYKLIQTHSITEDILNKLLPQK